MGSRIDTFVQYMYGRVKGAGKDLEKSEYRATELSSRTILTQWRKARKGIAELVRRWS
jgi:hypothetical protein